MPPLKTCFIGAEVRLQAPIAGVDTFSRQSLTLGIGGITTMKKYVCGPCGYVYDPAVGDPDSGIQPGTAFEDLPDDWVCPICGVGKDMFSPEE